MLVQAIPAYRLPREELAREIAHDRAHGRGRSRPARRSARTSPSRACATRATRPCSSASARRRASKLGIPGEDGEGVSRGPSLPRDYNVHGTAPVGKHVAVIGGGNAAIDAARTALRLAPSRSPSSTAARAPRCRPRPRRSRRPRRRASSSSRWSRRSRSSRRTARRPASSAAAMALGDFDPSGRRRPVAGRETRLRRRGDQVIAAIGQSLDREGTARRDAGRAQRGATASRRTR